MVVRGRELSITVSDITNIYEVQQNGFRILVPDSREIKSLYLIYEVGANSGIIDSIKLPEKYNNSYYEFRSPITTELTSSIGEARVCAEIVYDDGSHERTSSASMKISDLEIPLIDAAKIYSGSIGELRATLEKAVSIYRSSDAILRKEISTVKKIAVSLARELEEIRNGNA